MRIANLTWPFPFGVGLGWATTRGRNPAPGRELGRVYLFRGAAVVFSRGFGLMCDRLRAEGLWAEDLRCPGDLWARRHIEAGRAAGRLRGPVVLVGHSCGGRAALATARHLDGLGIPVELLVCIDVALPEPVAANVRQAVHLYRSRCRLYPARPLTLVAGSATLLENRDLDAEGSVISPAGLHHLNITASAAVQDWVVGRIVEVVGRGEAGA